MRLFQEIAKFFPAGGEAFRIQYTVLDGQGGYFRNVKSIGEFSPERILLRGKRGGVVVEGEALSLGKYFGEDAAVVGKIRRVERVD